ncbi:hypothetical protein FACS18949_14750 [Clostridia bacterium]|nr:hypothetical protein FACS18949_14750 [Clostridia bacterium]
MTDIIILILQCIAAYWVAGIFHELGHVLAGIAGGWKFQWIVVGFIGLKRLDSGHIRPYLEKNPLLWGGVGATLPCDGDTATTNVWATVLLCGPIASLVLGVISLPLGITLDITFLWILGAMSVGMGIACLLPVSSGILYTDGKRFMRLKGNGQEKAEEIALFKSVMQKIIEEDRFTLNQDDIEALKAAKLPNIQYYGQYYAYLFFKNNGDTDGMNRSVEAMKNIAAKVPKIIKAECVID